MFRTILKAKPYLTRAKMNLAICMYRLGQKNEAKRICREILEYVPDNQKAKDLWKVLAPDEMFPTRQRYRKYLGIYDMAPGEDFARKDYYVDDYYTLFYYYSSVDMSSQTSVTAAKGIASNSKFLVLRTVDVNRPDFENGVDLESPVAKAHGIKTVPYLALLDAEGKLLTEGDGTWKKILDLKLREEFLEKQGAGILELGGGELFPILELDGVDEVIDVKNYLTKDRVTIMEFWSIESEAYKQFISRVKELVDLRPDLRMVRVNLGTTKLPGQEPQPNFKSPNVNKYELEDIPYIQIYDASGKLIQTGEIAKKQIELWLNQK